MPDLILAGFAASVLAYAAWREHAHDRERREWTAERQRLMEHARPGLTLGPVIAAQIEDERETWSAEP